MVIFTCLHRVPRTFEQRCFEKPADASETLDVEWLTRQDHTCTPRVDGTTSGSLEKRTPCGTSTAQHVPIFLVHRCEARYLIQSRSSVRCVRRSKDQHTNACMRPVVEMQLGSGRSKPSVAVETTAAAVNVLRGFHVVFSCKYVSRLCSAHVPQHWDETTALRMRSARSSLYVI